MLEISLQVLCLGKLVYFYLKKVKNLGRVGTVLNSSASSPNHPLLFSHDLCNET